MGNTSGVICVIPARGGSKGIPGKNLIDFGGKPLLAWSIDVALQSGVIDRVIVSTDSEDIAEAARVAGAEVPFIRPPELANDAVHSVHVVFHALDWLEKDEGGSPEGVMMLLPTRPLRRPEDVCNAVSLFRTNKAPSVVSVCDLGKYLTNLRFMRQGRLVMAVPGENRNAQRQGAEKLYGVNGSIFLARPDSLRRAGSFHMDETLGYVMDDLDSVDINSTEDLLFARRLLKMRTVSDSDEGGADDIA
jgi:CMP-N-acetylneuraminic acid synthetase